MQTLTTNPTKEALRGSVHRLRILKEKNLLGHFTLLRLPKKFEFTS
jgi:hypothetical protein